jgi:hypothetical protein
MKLIDPIFNFEKSLLIIAGIACVDISSVNLAKAAPPSNPIPVISFLNPVSLNPHGIIYESSDDGEQFAGNLFDGIPVAGASDNLGAQFGAHGAFGDHSPIVAFDLGSRYTIDGAGYAQRKGSITGADDIQSITVYALTDVQFQKYIEEATLVKSGSGSSATGLPRSVPSVYIGKATITVTTQGDNTYTVYKFKNEQVMTGQYFVVQFFQTALTGNPGGSEFELTKSPVQAKTSSMDRRLDAAAYFISRL